MKNNIIRGEITCLFLAVCNEVSAHAGPVDRYIDMMRAQTTIAYIITIIVAAMYATNKFGYNVNKHIAATTKVTYCISWVMVGLGLFNSWPFFFATLLAPVYIYPVVKLLNVYKKTNPQNNFYKLLINLGFTFLGTIAFWVFMSVYSISCELLCSNFIPDILYYRNIRDDIYNATSFDINYISGLIVIYATWTFIKLLKQYNKENKDYQ